MKRVSTKATRAASLLLALSALALWMTMSLPFGAMRVAKATPEPNPKITGRRLDANNSIRDPQSATGNRQFAVVPAAPQAIFTVDRTDDVSPPATGCSDVTPNDCSLRGAVIKANTTGGTDTIAVPAGTYTLTIPGIGEEAAMTGDLDLTESVTLQGAGAGTIIQAGTTSPVPTPASCTDCIDRVFHVVSSGVTAEFMDLTIRHGKEPVSGGGIFNNGTAKLTNSTLANNTAPDGGGILNNSGSLTISKSTLSNNLASSSFGGGILNNSSGIVEITNSTLSNNVAGNAGGGIFNLNTATISNSTLSHNAASNLGGGIFNANALTIKNSIVANSLAGGNCVNSGGTFTALGKNFDTDGTGAALDPDFMTVTPAQLNLGPLQNNGGPTETRALLPGSLAIDTVTDCTKVDGATPVTEDQRGVTRPIDGDASGGTALCDAGAYEAPTPASQVYMVDRTDDVSPPATGCNDLVPNDCSLRGAVIKANTTVATVAITVPTGTYTLTIAGENEDAATTGDLDLTQSMTIQGAGAASTIIQAGTTSPGPGCADCIDRVFHVVTGGVTAEFKDITIRHGDTALNGGGIRNLSSTVKITNCAVSANSADDGGGIYNNGGTVEITGSTVSANRAGDGGGILSDSGTVEVTASTLSNNIAFANGGGINNREFSSATITNSTLSNNSANNQGGGMFNVGAATISNSTLSNNAAFGNGGGGIKNLETLTIKNSIVANSTAGGDYSNNGGTLTALGKNFDTDGTAAAFDPDFMQVTSAQLNLGPLQNNGGPTQTRALLPGSVAIDAVTDCTRADGATSVTEDQRGVMRPLDGDNNGTALCDAGALEAPAAQVLTVDRTDDVSPPATGCNDAVPNDCSLRGAVIKSNTLISMDTIMVPAGTYTLTIAGAGEDAAMTGDLDLTQPMTMQGAGAASTIIQAGTSSPVPGPCANCIDRVFHIVSSIGTAEFKDITIRHGNDPGDGGGIFVNSGTVKITGATLSNNRSGNDGGGIFNNGGTVEIMGSTVSNNSSGNVGGGILNLAGPLKVTNSTLSNNISIFNGGSIYNNSGTVEITGSTLSNNNGGLNGGAVTNAGGTMEITGSALSNNSGAFQGGGINNINFGTLEITGSTLVNNSAPDPNGSGGGIFNQEFSSATITNSTLSNNSAGFQGGGIFNAGTATISNGTFSNNSAPAGSGGGILNQNELTIKNSIVANSPSGGNCVNTATFTALGKNFDTDGTGAALDPDFMQVTPAQLNLGPLQNNGGPTETCALLPGSVAIDAVTDCTKVDGTTALTTDQRGVTRPIDGDGNATPQCDAGAYEAPLPPTEITLVSFTATSYDGGALIEWRTGFEADNLGFNVYREQDGRRIRINPRLVAGSALLVGPSVRLASGRSYAWTEIGRSSKQTRYWLEEVDLKGHSTWHGPAAAQSPDARGKGTELVQQSAMLGGIAVGEQTQSSPLQATAEPAHISLVNTQTQAVLASRHAAKISVNAEGWYRVSQRELASIGFNTRVNPQLLQLFVDGRELPMVVQGEQDGSFDAADSIEFYGLGVDTPFTDSRTYWLVAGNVSGLRVSQTKSEGVTQSPESFNHTVERRDRSIYFSALRNGEKENFFGAVVAINTTDQMLTLSHLAETSLGNARVEIVLQGVTLREHQVRVALNGTSLGEVLFSGQSEGTADFTVPQSLLREGANTVQLTPLAGPSDVSLVGSIRLSYQRRITADNDALKLTAAGQQPISIEGFTSKSIRVFDVTDPDSPRELLGEVKQQATGYSVTFVSADGGQRAFLAVARDQRPYSITLNHSSNLRKAKASYVIITRRQFFDSFEPLAALRKAKGLSVAIVDIEDIYDEFSFGQKSPYAVRDFLAWANSNWKKKPRFVLFAGDASYDPRSYLGLGDGDLVPTKLVDTNLMETASDDWLADFDDDGVADLAVGRLPIRTAEEASLLVSRIIAYEKSPPDKEVLLAADANDGFDFESANDRLAGLVPPGLRITQVNRGRVDPETAKSILLDSIHRGQKLVNYTGHGSASELRGDLLTNADALALRNDHLPVFVMMTCLNGYFHNALADSLAESLLKAEHGGAIAVWASSGLTEPADQAVMNQEFYRQLFNQRRAITLGEAVMRAKSSITDSDIRRTWVLLGDPAMKLN